MERATHMLTVDKNIGVPDSNTTPPDTPEECFDKKHFASYSKKITYRYNSKGFRDDEWPEDLSDVVWCVGDSFTVGIGQPFEETWPQVLQQELGKRCINIGENGCSNDKIQLRVNQIVNQHHPKLIVVMWTYPWRRLVDGKDVHYDKGDFGVDKDMANFKKNVDLCGKDTNIIHAIIPTENNAELFAKTYINMWTKIFEKYSMPKMIIFPHLDHARDYYHFDIKTSQHVVGLIKKQIIL